MIFGPETFEGASLPGLFDSVGVNFGSATVALDATSKLSDVYSLKFGATGSGRATAIKDIGSPIPTFHTQFLLKFSSDFALGVSDFLTLLLLNDSGTGKTVFFQIENNSSLDLSFTSSDGGYVSTPISFARDVAYRIEIQVVKSDTVGRVRIWINSNNEGSPTYDSGDINTSAGGLDQLNLGLRNAPEALTGNFFIDNVYIDSAFIGFEATPFRFENLPGIVFDEEDTRTIYAERLNDILERIEALESS